MSRAVTLKKRVKIEVADGDREKVTITLEGDMSRERILHLMDLLQLLNITDKARPEEPEELSKFEKVRLLIKRKFPTGWFTSQDIMVAYEDSYDEPIGLSTVSTYLVRLVDRGDVTRSGSITTRRYRIRKTEVPDEGNRGLANLD
ncbi:hypothetical protein MUP00_11105 [Candidatus Bathyarchaeota archaeon]|jgi:hypothetical protein|nr:hypothetical protein [Candidatus Bathyarchaeota archaeon]